MRTCDCCGTEMYEGFYADGEYYCSEKCLSSRYSQEEWAKLYEEDEDGDSYYWTTWYDEEDEEC